MVLAPSSSLRRRCVLVSERRLHEVSDLVETMLEEVRLGGGIGLAAPQVDSDLRVVVLVPPDVEPIVMLNPRVTWRSRERSSALEGCLSIPGQLFEVERPSSVVVRWEDLSFVPREDGFDGLMARLAQHEIDHLDGFLISDRGAPRTSPTLSSR